jgi:hypothetical protein
MQEQPKPLRKRQVCVQRFGLQSGGIAAGGQKRAKAGFNGRSYLFHRFHFHGGIVSASLDKSRERTKPYTIF